MWGRRPGVLLRLQAFTGALRMRTRSHDVLKLIAATGGAAGGVSGPRSVVAAAAVHDVAGCACLVFIADRPGHELQFALSILCY